MTPKEPSIRPNHILTAKRTIVARGQFGHGLSHNVGLQNVWCADKRSRCG